MIYSIYANKDTTLYEATSSLNTGIDSTLELSHHTRGSGSTFEKYNSRVLLYFNVDYIKNQIQGGQIHIDSASWYLDMKVCEAKEIPTEYTIYAFPLSGSWSRGTGRYSNKPKTENGASWLYRTSKDVGVQWEIPVIVENYTWDEMFSAWIDSDLYFGSGSPSLFVTGSYCTTAGGGNWYFGSQFQASQSFSWETSDIYMNVTQVARHWVTSSEFVANDGMILKHSDTTECSNDDLGSMKFFSTDSNTIYVPRLLVMWDDSVWSTGSLSAANMDNAIISPKLKRVYKQEEKAKIRLHVRPKYPTKTWVTSSVYVQNYYVPTSSYWSIVDYRTNEIVYPFSDTGTKISCDSTGNYFNLWMNGLQPERFYKVVLKVVTDGGNTEQYYDSDHIFKVVR